MSSSKRVIALVIAALLVTCVTMIAASTPAHSHLKQVDSKFVCMINKKHFNHAQTAVVLDGHTYYACCEDCKKQLTENKASRMDKDPVSGKEVDKAIAVVGIDYAGNAFFFETKENMKKFQALLKPTP